MTTLGLSGSLPSGEVVVGLRKGWLRYFKLALSSAGGAAAVLAIFTLLERQPVEGFRLLGAWGPWPVVIMLALLLAGGFISRLTDTIGTSFGAIVSSAQQTAGALTRLAEQSGEQARETHRLAMFAAQESQSLYERLDRQDEVLQAIQDYLSKGESHGTTGDGSGA